MSGADSPDAVPPESADAVSSIGPRRQRFRDALDAMERALAAPATGRFEPWREGTSRALAALQAVIELHVAETEAPGGLLDLIRTDAPRLVNGVGRLQEQHRLLLSSVRGLADRLPAASEDDIGLLRQQALELLGLLVRHRQLGADLVYEAYNVDVGGGD